MPTFFCYSPTDLSKPLACKVWMTRFNVTSSLLRCPLFVREFVPALASPQPVISSSQSVASLSATSGPVLIVDPITNSSFIKSLVSSGKLDVPAVEGQWKAFTTTLVRDPAPNPTCPRYCKSRQTWRYLRYVR